MNLKGFWNIRVLITVIFMTFMANKAISSTSPILDIANDYLYTTPSGYKEGEVLLNFTEHKEFLFFNQQKEAAVAQLSTAEKNTALGKNLAKYFYDVGEKDSKCQNFSWDIFGYYFYNNQLNFAQNISTIPTIEDFYLHVEKQMRIVSLNLKAATERLAQASVTGVYPQGDTLNFLKMFYADTGFLHGLDQFYFQLPQLQCAYCQNIDTDRIDALYASIVVPADDQFRLAIQPLTSHADSFLAMPQSIRGVCYSFVVHRIYSRINPQSVLNKGLRELQKSEMQMMSVANSMGYFIQMPESIPAYIKRVFNIITSKPSEIVTKKEDLEALYASYYQRALVEMPKISSKAILLPLSYEINIYPESPNSFTSAGYSINDPDNGANPVFYTLMVGPKAQFAKLELPVLFFHEAIPGHHFERSYQFVTTKAKTEFEKNHYYPEYTEGWGFYTEELALEHNLYTSPEEIFGFWDLQRLRALRMIVSYRYFVDGWTKEQGTKYFEEHTFGDTEQAEADAARPTDTQGQAISYMIGKTVIQGLRDLQQDVLNRCASEVEFHDYILDQTGTGMDTLVSTFSTWIMNHKCYNGSSSLSEMEERAHQKILNRF